MRIATLLVGGTILLLVPAVLAAYAGFVVGQPDPGRDLGACESANLVFTGSDIAQMFVLVESFLDENDILYSIEGNSKTLGGTYGPDGIYDFPGSFFPTYPPDDTVWVVATAYPGADPGGTHQGWVHLDNTPGWNEDMADGLVPNMIQRLRLPQAAVVTVTGPSGPVRGVEFTFEHVTEFDTQAGDLPCEAGGVQPPEFEHRIIQGFNVYRLNVTQTGVDPDVARPIAYLCGPDLDCGTTGDNGFLVYIPLGDGTDEMSVDPPYDDPKPDDAFRVEDRGNPNPNIVFLDVPGLSPDPPDDWGGSEYAYIYQPVIKGVPDSTWNGIPSHDLDGDTLPEFLDPSGNGLGLTASGPNPTAPVILVSGVVVVDTSGIPPAPLPPALHLPWPILPGSDPAGTPPVQRGRD